MRGYGTAKCTGVQVKECTMADVINELSITYIKYAAGKLSVAWELNGGNVETYAGITYTYEITGNGVRVQSGDFQDVEGDASKQIAWTKENDGAVYAFRMYVKDQANASDERELVVGEFRDVAGSFDGERFVFVWDVSDDLVSDGYMKIQQEGPDGKILLHIPVSPLNRKLVTDPVNLAMKASVCVVFTASDGEICEGPDSQPLYFFPKGVEIQEASITDIPAAAADTGAGAADHGICAKKLTLTLIGAEQMAGLAKCRVLLKKNGRLVYASDALEIKTVRKEAGKETGDAKATVEVTVSAAEVRPQLLEKCVVSCIYVNGGAESAVMTELSEMSLAVPEVIPLAIGPECRAEFRIAGEIEPVGYEVSGNAELAAEQGACSSDFIARARYDIGQAKMRKGPASPYGFPECFYADADTVYYRAQAYEEKEQRIAVPAAFFQTKLEEPVHEHEGFCLNPPSKEGQDYILELKTEAALPPDQYQAFLADLITKGKLTSEGFYRICDTIMRAGAYKKSDTALFQCRYMPGERTADVCPGLILRVETAMYLPQYNQKIKSAAGFAWMHASDIEVRFHAGRTNSGADSGFLEWNSFASGMYQKLNEGITANGGAIIYAAGVEDLMRTQAHLPYYRIMYPSAMLAPDDVTPYPSDNIILLAADGYDKLTEACNSIKRNPACINNLNIPIIVFRGRGMLSLWAQVSVNREMCRVPVGSTWQQVLTDRGVTVLDRVKLFRRGIDGKELRVYGNLDGIFPLQGDRVEV